MIQKSPHLFAIALVLASAPLLPAQIVRYSENFEAPDAVSATPAGPSQFVQLNNVNQNPGGWQVQGGTSGSDTLTLSAGVDNLGVAGSQALFANWNHAGAAPSQFVFNQYAVTGLAGFPASVTESQITVALDIFISGSEDSNSPITVVFAGNNGAINRGFIPVLANNQFTHVEFTLNQTAGSPVDVTQPFNLRLLHSAAGFGFDADNIVRLDNISVTAVPEPHAALLGAWGVFAAWRAARKRRTR